MTGILGYLGLFDGYFRQGIVIVCIVAVIVGAVGAFLIRYAVETVQESCLNPCSTIEYVRPTAQQQQTCFVFTTD